MYAHFLTSWLFERCCSGLPAMIWKSKSLTRVVILAVTSIFFGLLSAASAQTETATIRGSVADSSGALIAGATVRLIDVDRGPSTQMATGKDGSYNFASVHPGRFRMEVEKSEFKPIQLTGITVNVQDNLEEIIPTSAILITP